MEKKVKWQLSDRLISYFASSIYGENFDVIAVREALQNAVDAKAKTFRVHLIDDRNVIIENNGEPMSLSVIENQLFTLGESTKTDGTSVGYFGIGECAIISPCEKWKIETGNLVVEDFTVKDGNGYFKGTRHTLTFRKDIRRYRIKDFLEEHNVKTKITVQTPYTTEQYKPQNFAKCRKFDIPNGSFIWKKSGDTHTTLRVNGVPQKVETRYDNCGTWIIDLTTSEILTVNREDIRDEKTKEAVQTISEHIRRISEHVSGDRYEQWEQLTAPFPFYRKSGTILRRDVSSEPIRKMYECLETVDNWYLEQLRKQITGYVHKHKIGLCATRSETQALVREDTILINVQDRNINPPSTFVLHLIDDYCHELAHVISTPSEHEKYATTLRYMAYDNPEIYEALRKRLRYGKT